MQHKITVRGILSIVIPPFVALIASTILFVLKVSIFIPIITLILGFGACVAQLIIVDRIIKRHIFIEAENQKVDEMMRRRGYENYQTVMLNQDQFKEFLEYGGVEVDGKIYQREMTQQELRSIENEYKKNWRYSKNGKRK